MKKTISLLLVSLAGCATATTTTVATTKPAATTVAATTAKPGPTGAPVKIGLGTVLTGDRALEGKYATNIVKILEQEINGAGGVLGRPLQIVVQDSLGTDIGAVNAYRKLADDKDIVAIIGSDSSNDNLATAADAKKLMIPTVGQGSSPKLNTEALQNPWLFQLRAVDGTLCTALMKYAVEKLGYKKFAVIHDTETASADQARLFTEALKALNITPVITVPFTTGTKDFTSHLVQIQKLNVDAIVAASFGTEAAILVQQIRSMGMDKMPIFGSNVYADPIVIALAKDAMNGVYCATHWVPTTPNPKGKAIATKYKDLYKEDLGKAGAQVYDHVYILCEAIKRAGSTDRTKVRDAMNTIVDYQGAMTIYDISTNGDCGRGGLLVQVVNQQANVLGEISAGLKPKK
jgi:branched-chain amino acid transport system substrate-binding protein